MATEFIMPQAPTTTYTASPAQYTLYSTTSQPVSPVASIPTTPLNVSPASPRSALPLQTRQLRPPKSPLYVPAVLRPTEPPRRVAKPSPLTPPQSMNSSFDDLKNVRPLSRRSTMDSGKFGLGKIAEGDWGSITDKSKPAPTKKHWKHDSEALVCDEPSCIRPFSFYNRRHHCRRCGNIFCAEHSAQYILLDEDANYDVHGAISRSCEYCFGDFQGWEIARLSRSNSECSDDTPPTPTVAVGCGVGKRGSGALAGVLGLRKDGTPESLGQSVPRDWSWSTF